VTDGTWPDIPPEVPPPRHPELPPEPEPARPTAPPVPMVLPATRARDRSLADHRIVLLLGPLDHDLATRTAAEVMTLDATGDGEITLHMSCPDGDLLAALMLAETIHLTAAPVIAIARGVVGGVALAPFAAAGRRTGSSRATFRMSEPHGSLSGIASEVTAGAEELRQHVDRLQTWLVEATGQPKATIAEDLQRGRILDAADALAYGLLDEITGRSETAGPERDGGPSETASSSERGPDS
jgi:ATP-dependent Clp protease, protease subunit